MKLTPYRRYYVRRWLERISFLVLGALLTILAMLIYGLIVVGA